MSSLKTLAAATLGVVFLGGLVYWSNMSTPDRTRRIAIAQRERAAQPAAGDAAELTQVSLPHQVKKGGFVASDSCVECHQEQYDSWHGTYHRTMTQVATPETVVAPFNGIQLASRGRVYYLSQEDDKFFVTMADPDWEAGAQANGIDLAKANPPIVKLEVVMTTGSHHMQGYWVGSRTKNMLRQVPWAYLIEDQKWVPREDIFLEPPDAERHLIVWNDNCIVCHAVAGSPNFDLRKMTVNTEVAELGISCEACHGPGEPHIAFHKKERSPTGTELSKDPIMNPGTCDSRVSAEICGQCHSYFISPDPDAFGKGGYTYRAGGNLRDSHVLVSYEQAKQAGEEMAMSVFWNDGTCRVSGREYSAMTSSPCYIDGSLSCVACHSMHESDPVNQLAKSMETNEACLQCHSSMANRIEEHTHHSADSSGSLCYNCHMPYTTYGLLKALRSHRIQTPRIAGNEGADQPNACNLCHLDQTLAWTSEKLTEWYDQPSADLKRDDQETSAALHWLLRGNAVQRSIAAWHMNWQPALDVSGDGWQAPFLAELLDDDYSPVRYLASKALRRTDAFADAEYDYVGTDQSHKAAKQMVRDAWRAREVPTVPANSSQLLLDSESGQVMLERLKQLLRNQDNSPMLLPE